MQKVVLNQAEKDLLLKVIPSLTQQCITVETGVALLSQILVSEHTEATLEEKLQAIKLLSHYQMISVDDAKSYASRIASDMVMTTISDSRFRQREKHSRKSSPSPKYQRLFKKGDLSSSLIEIIGSNNLTKEQILSQLSVRSGLEINMIRQTATASLSKLSLQGKIDRSLIDGVAHYNVLEYDSKQQFERANQ